MRSFAVTVLASRIECFEIASLRRVDYTAQRCGGETLVYKVSVSHKGGRVSNGRDRGAMFVHYHARNLSGDYKFVVEKEKS